MGAATRTVTASVGQDAGALAVVVARLRRALRTSVRSEYAWERLPMAQVEILQRLAEEPGLRISDLATRHHLAINTVSNLVQQLVLAGLVERSSDQVDRRAVSVTLTDHGRGELASWLEANNRRLAHAMGRLEIRDQRAIAQAVPSLARLVEQLELDDGGPEGAP
jgi:DNA-binding MarR family transcriptional regulator